MNNTGSVLQIDVRALTSSVLAIAATFLLVASLYGGIKIVANIAVFGERYPQGGVFNFFGNYFQREEDCIVMMPQVYYDNDGRPRLPTAEEIERESKQKESCLSSVRESRQLAKVNDFTTTAGLFLAGVGCLVARRVLARG